MAVTSACMHHAGIFTGECKAGFFLDRYTVNIGSQQDGLCVFACFFTPYIGIDAGNVIKAQRFQTHFLKLAFNGQRRLHFLPCRLGKAVKIASLPNNIIF